jgi:hypothetical protein
MDDGEQLEDVSRIGLLGRGELAALVRDRVVLAVVVRLSEDSGDSHFASVGRKDRASTRVEGAKDRGRREAPLQVVEAPLLSLPPLPLSVRAAQTCEGCCDVRVLVDKAPVVVAQPHKAAEIRVGVRNGPVPHR